MCGWEKATLGAAGIGSRSPGDLREDVMVAAGRKWVSGMGVGLGGLVGAGGR